MSKPPQRRLQRDSTCSAIPPHFTHFTHFTHSINPLSSTMSFCPSPSSTAAGIFPPRHIIPLIIHHSTYQRLCKVSLRALVPDRPPVTCRMR